MAAHLTRFSKKTKVIGLVGFGSGGPDGWRNEWRDKTGAEKYVEKPMDHVSQRSPDLFRAVGLCRSGRLNALGRRRRLHSISQPAALTDENQPVRQPAQRSRGEFSKNIPSAQASHGKNTLITCKSRIRIGSKPSKFFSPPARMTKATGSKATVCRISGKCSWARSTLLLLAARTSC